MVELVRHERGSINDVGSLAQNAWSKWDLAEMTKISNTYSKLIQESKFVLCPRGNGTSSIRLFEAMKLGRAPVVISDNWVPPSGPDWNSFSITIPENEIGQIPRLLEEIEDKSVEMGRRAEIEWNNWFSNQGSINSILQFLKIQKAIDLEENEITYSKRLTLIKMKMKYLKMKVIYALTKNNN